MKKAIYLPTKQKTIIVSETEAFYEILLENDYKTVSKEEVELIQEDSQKVSLEEFKRSVYIDCIQKPLSDVLYSFSTNRLTPEPHQYKPLIKFIQSENNRILIADEVGLGKTIEAGMIYKEIDQREHLAISMIVVPPSLALKWREEFLLRFDESFEVFKVNEFVHFLEECHTYGNTKTMHKKIILSYNTLRSERITKLLKESFIEIDFLIMDEAHTMRNADTSTFESAQLLTSRANSIIFLSATPVQNDISDLFNILSLLEPDYFKDFGFFQKMIRPNKTIHKIIAFLRNKHPFAEVQEYVRQVLEEGTDDFELELLLQEIIEKTDPTPEEKIRYINQLLELDYLSFIINRTKKKDVGRSNPRSAKSVAVEATPEEKRYYSSVIELTKLLHEGAPEGFITIMPERLASSSMIMSLKSLKHAQKTKKYSPENDDMEEYEEEKKRELALGSEKIREVLARAIKEGEAIGETDSKFDKFLEIMQEIHAQGIRQLIVFSFFKRTVDYLYEKLSALGYKAGKIHGDIDAEARFETIKHFRKKEFDILLSSEVGSEGLDMQFCNVIVNYDLPWNPMRVEQRIGRIDRIGQTFDKLLIFNLSIAGSIEDRILNRLYSKLGIFESSVGELEPILGDMEEQLDIPALIHLSEEEIEKKLHWYEMAAKRQAMEIEQQMNEVEKLLNADINYESNLNELLGTTKMTLLQEQTRNIFLHYLQANQIVYTELKNGSIKLGADAAKNLLNLLKKSMSDRQNNAEQRLEERRELSKLHRQKELRFRFAAIDPDSDDIPYIHPMHPVLKMIIKEQVPVFPALVTLHHPEYPDHYAVIYRLDISQYKSKSLIQTLVMDQSFEIVATLDYFDFIGSCCEAPQTSIDNEKIIKQHALRHIETLNQTIITEESRQQKRILQIKTESVAAHYDKKIAQVEKSVAKVTQADIRRMQESQIENLQTQKNDKIEEIRAQMQTRVDFKILGILNTGAKDGL